MEFPVFQPPYLGNGMVIGLNAVIHVFISHGLAIGAFALIAWCDWISWKETGAKREAWNRFTKRFLRFVVLAVTIAGAVTGVGIWLTISALAPRATGSMLRIFFWPWFLEFHVFMWEVLFLLWLYQSWDRLAEKRAWRLTLEGAYVVLALASAVAITGILGFMLTPGAWLEERSLGTAFFNPSFVPQLLSRLAFGFGLGALAALVWTTFWAEAAIQRDAFFRFGLVVVASLAVLGVAASIYFVTVPLPFTERTRFSVLTSNFSQYPELLLVGNILVLGLALLAGIAAVARKVEWVRWLAVPGLVGLMAWVAQFERVREFIRGPFLMPGYLYANGVLVEEQSLLNRSGMLALSHWHSGVDVREDPLGAGAFLFARNCSACHTMGGLNSIQDRLRGRSEQGIRVLLDQTHNMVSFMPPFSGQPEERRATARFLYELTRDNVPLDSMARYRVRREGRHD